MKAVFVLAAAVAGFLRHSTAEVPAGCCHQCEFCCYSECLEKFQAEVSAEPEAALVQTPGKANVFRSCLQEKATCGKWTEERKQETLACLTESAKPAAAAPSFVQTAECPDTIDLCQKRVPIGAMESGAVNMESCAEACMTEFCGCPGS